MVDIKIYHTLQLYWSGDIAIPELKGLIIPDNTIMEEHSIVVDGDIFVGKYAELGFGLIANTVVAGEHVKINGSILTENEVRIDMWSEVTGDVRTKTDAYLGEFARVNGKLYAAGSLDVGNNVKIDGGYDVKGWLVVRNPLPVVMFIFFYLMALLRLGNEEEVEKALEELFSDDTPPGKLMSIPNRARISLEEIKTASRVVVGSHCRLLGNIRARSAAIGDRVTLFGSVRTAGDITVGRSCTVHGNIVSTKNVKIARNCRVLGKVTADAVVLHETAKVDGTLIAPNGITVERDDLEGLDDTEKRLFYGFTMLEDI